MMSNALSFIVLIYEQFVLLTLINLSIFSWHQYKGVKISNNTRMIRVTDIRS
jgi:hypothetical protein